MEGGDFFSSHSSNGTLRNHLSGKAWYMLRVESRLSFRTQRQRPVIHQTFWTFEKGCSFLYETSQCRALAALGFKRWGETFQWGWERPHQCESLEAWWKVCTAPLEWLKSPFNHASMHRNAAFLCCADLWRFQSGPNLRLEMAVTEPRVLVSEFLLLLPGPAVTAHCNTRMKKASKFWLDA